MIGVLIKKKFGDKHTYKGMLCANEDRGQCDASIGQGTSKIVSKPPKSRQEALSLTVLRRNPTNNFILDF